MIDFPSSPIVGQVATSPSGTAWRWNGTTWLLGTGASASGMRGLIGYAEITTGQSGITTLTDVVGLSITFNAKAGRSYRVTSHLYLTSTVGSTTELGVVSLRSSQAGQIQSQITYHTAANSLYKTHVEAIISPPVNYTPLTAWVQAGRNSGTGTFTVSAGGNYPSYITVEDITYDGGPSAGSGDDTPTSGSNANGYWIKYGDGTMQCWHNWTETIAINTAYSTLFLGLPTNWSYPVAFLTGTTPVVSISLARWGTAASWGQVQSASPSSATIRVLDNQSRAAGVVTFAASAIGRWK